MGIVACECSQSDNGFTLISPTLLFAAGRAGVRACVSKFAQA